MRTELVSLRHLRAAPPGVLALSEPTGRDEMSVDGVDTRSAVGLLDRLLPPDANVRSIELTAADRDALLAALYRQCWGDRISATLTCVACGRPFDLTFDLSHVQRHLAATAHVWHAAEGRVTHDDGRSFAVPTAADEIAAAGLGHAAGAAQLGSVAGAAGGAIDQAAAALEAGAPIIDLDLDARCADCGHDQRAHFDLQSYLLQRLLNERETLLTDVHVLATRYGWSLDEILSLPRATRRSFTTMASDRRSLATDAPHRRARL